MLQTRIKRESTQEERGQGRDYRAQRDIYHGWEREGERPSERSCC